MGIVSCSGNRFDEPCSDHGAFQITGTALDELRPVVGELPFVFIELNGVTHDGTHRRRGDDIRIESVLIHRLLLLEGGTVCHVHRLADRPLDVVVVGRQVEEVLMEELDMRLGFHREVCFQPGTLCQEGNIAVQYVDLLPFFRHEGDAAPDGEPADEGAATYRGQHRHQGEFRFLC